MSRDTSERLRSLVGASRAEILRELSAADEGLTSAEVAERIGLHVNTTREHLRHLADVGMVEVAAAGPAERGRGRPPLRYRLVSTDLLASAAPVPAADLTGYRALAEALTEALVATTDTPLVTAMEAGRNWGAAEARRRGGDVTEGGEEEAVQALVGALDDLGFRPEEHLDEGSVDLTACPFAALARRHPGIVCGIHLGIAQGFLQEIRAPVTAASLEPFVAPSRCRLHVRRALALPV